MHIKLTCSECKSDLLVPYAQLYAIWKQGYEALPAERQSRAQAQTNVTCDCGNRDSYDTPMFDWVFQTIFNEFVKEDAVV